LKRWMALLTALAVLLEPIAAIKVAVFAPRDAEPTCVKVIEDLLKRNGVQVVEVKGKDVSNGALMKGGKPAFDAFIMPGGSYADRMLARIHFIDALKRYLEAGGRVVGICAGAVVLVKSGIVKGEVVELGKGIGKVTVKVVDENSPITKGLPRTFTMWYLNGPVMKSKGAETVAVYAGGKIGQGDAVLVQKVGNGTAVAIGPHCHDPQGNVDPTAAKLVLNAVGIQGAKTTVGSAKPAPQGGHGGYGVPVSLGVVLAGMALLGAAAMARRQP